MVSELEPLRASSSSSSPHPPASNFIIETWRTKGTENFFVRLMYNGDLQSLPYCKNQQLCTWTEFVSYLQSKILPNYSECFAA